MRRKHIGTGRMVHSLGGIPAWFLPSLALVAAAAFVACGGNGDSAQGPVSGGDAAPAAAAPPPSGNAEAQPTQSPTPTAEPSAGSTPTVRSLRTEGSAETDREALVAFYNATGGQGWDDSGTWLSSAPIGEWAGVTTHWEGEKYGRVAVLRHFGDQLSGEIPAELGNLTYLNELDLGSKGLSGEIPPELGNLINLRWLDLSGNQLSGEIPPELGNLSNLISLYLSSNQLTGCVPAILKGQLDMVSSDLGGLPFCGE